MIYPRPNYDSELGSESRNFWLLLLFLKACKNACNVCILFRYLKIALGSWYNSFMCIDVGILQQPLQNQKLPYFEWLWSFVHSQKLRHKWGSLSKARTARKDPATTVCADSGEHLPLTQCRDCFGILVPCRRKEKCFCPRKSQTPGGNC